MFSLEFVSGRPLGSAPYYSLVVREPYIVGSTRGSDIMLDHDDIMTHHASLTVMRESQALKQQQRVLRKGVNGIDDSAKDSEHVNDDENSNNGGGGVVGSFLNDMEAGMNEMISVNRTDTEDLLSLDNKTRENSNNNNNDKEGGVMSTDHANRNDPLVLRVVNLRDGGRILANETEVVATPLFLADGAQLQFGDHIRLRLRFRPLLVSIARNAFSDDRVRELRFMFHRLGATEAGGGPAPHVDAPPPIGRLHCVETLSDDPGCLMALACGYSIVQPAYVLEWFAAIAQSAALPLTVLPPPVRFEVPIQYHDLAPAHAAFYLRPESDVCPFPLYPIPSTATRKRSRDALFKNKKFFFLTNAVEHRYKEPVLVCGGEVLCLEDIVTIVAKSEGARGAGGGEAETEAEAEAKTPTKQNDDEHDGDGDHAEVNNDTTEGGSIINTPKENKEKNHQDEGEKTEVMYYVVVDTDTEALIRCGGCSVLGGVRDVLEDAHCAGIVIPVVSERSLFNSLLINRFTPLEITWSSAADSDQFGGKQTPNEALLTPLVEDIVGEKGVFPTPLWRDGHGVSPASNMARSVSSRPRRRIGVNDRTVFSSVSQRREHNTPAGGTRTTARRGQHRRGSLASSQVNQLVDTLRHRVRAFVSKELPKLRENLAGTMRNFFVDTEVLEHAKECGEQSASYLQKIDVLLSDPAIQDSRLSQELRLSLRDCNELFRTAYEVVELSTLAAQRSHHPSRHRRVFISSSPGYPFFVSPISGSLPPRPAAVDAGQRRARSARPLSPAVRGLRGATARANGTGPRPRRGPRSGQPTASAQTNDAAETSALPASCVAVPSAVRPRSAASRRRPSVPQLSGSAGESHEMQRPAAGRSSSAKRAAMSPHAAHTTSTKNNSMLSVPPALQGLPSPHEALLSGQRSQHFSPAARHRPLYPRRTSSTRGGDARAGSPALATTHTKRRQQV